jgi:hypothetical protein
LEQTSLSGRYNDFRHETIIQYNLNALILSPLVNGWSDSDKQPENAAPMKNSIIDQFFRVNLNGFFIPSRILTG